MHPSISVSLLFLLALLATSPGFAQGRYIAFGDSITQGTGFDDCPIDEPSLCGYPIRLETRLNQVGQNVTVENHGKGGEKTIQGVTRIDTVLNETGVGVGDTLLLMEGSNDISTEVNPEAILFNLDEIARKAEDRGLETIQATLILRYPQAVRDADNVENRALVEAIRMQAFSRSRRLVDPFEVFSQTPNLFGTYYAPASPEDPVGHPNPTGFDLLTEVFFDLLRGRDTVPPVKAFVEPVDGSLNIAPLAPIRVRVYDFGSGVDPLLAGLTINGQSVAVDVSNGGDDWLDIVHQPIGGGLTGQVVVRVQAGDRAQPVNTMNRPATIFTVDETALDPCFPDENTLCIDDQPGDRRFRVQLSWETALNGGLSGDAVVTPLDSLGFATGGLLSFFEGTPEALVKVLSGCGANNRFWVFAALTTTLGFDLLIEDTVAKAQGAPVAVYRYEVHNNDGSVAAAVADIQAFSTCTFGP
jgi:lysophospholipase L1-like esterase